MEANDYQGPEPPIPLGPQSPPRVRASAGTYIALARSPMAFSPNSFSYQKPSWHICKSTPKPSWKLLPKFKEKGPKPIHKKKPIYKKKYSIYIYIYMRQQVVHDNLTTSLITARHTTAKLLNCSSEFKRFSTSL